MRHIPCELKAVLHIFNHDEELKTKALPHVDLEKQRVDWFSIFRNHFGSGHYSAVLWAYCIWKDEPSPGNPFDAAFSMDAGLKRTVIRALAIRWCIPIDQFNPFHCV